MMRVVDRLDASMQHKEVAEQAILEVQKLGIQWGVLMMT